MNPDQWFKSADAIALLNAMFPMHGSGSMAEQPRKLSLYYCNLARLLWHVLPDPHRGIIEIAEHNADAPRKRRHKVGAYLEIARDMFSRSGTADDLVEFRHRLFLCGWDRIEPDRELRWTEEQWHHLSVLISYPLEPVVPNPGAIPRSIHRADLVRDAFLHRDVRIRFDADWRTSSAVSLADCMYETRDFAAMPALADVLEEGGCSDDRILDHCRDPHAMHARGCWVVDFLLERE